MGEKADSDLVRRQNRWIVLKALRQYGKLARIDVGRATGLSPASITAITAQLVEDKVIEELDPLFPLGANIKRGRPTVSLALNRNAAHVIAIKLSIDDIEMVLSDFHGTVVARKFLTTPTFESRQVEFGRRVADDVSNFIAESGFSPGQIARIGVATQGLANTRDGSIAWSPAFRARNIPVCAPIERRVGIPCSIGNDANMIAEGLSASGMQRYDGVTATVFTGYGVGMGLIIDGKVFHGATGAASELGHMNHIPYGAMCRCGKRGCLEAYVADYGILRAARGDADDVLPPPSAIPAGKMADLLKSAQAGDAAALNAYAGAGEALGYGIARMIAIVNPQRVVIAGPGLDASQFTEPATRRALADALVDELRHDVLIEYTSFSTDMIIKGTTTALLREIDSQIFAAGPMPQSGTQLESVA